MLNRVFPRGSGVASGIDYGLSETDHTGQKRAVAPKILFGDPEAVKAVVETMTSRNRYTAGVLAFTEPNIGRRLKRLIINEHLRVTFPGVDVREVAACYIEHRDKPGITEIHYWIANTHLPTGKCIKPYYHVVDQGRLRIWVQSVNDRFLLSDPNDPERWRLAAPPKRGGSETRQTMQKRLLDGLSKLALAGLVRCRAEIEAAIEKVGWQVSRRTKTFISVTHPSISLPIRLAGRMFSGDWSGAPSAEDIKQLAQRFQEERLQRIRETSQRLIELIKRRIEYNARRFGSGGIHCTDSLISALDGAEEAAVETKVGKLQALLSAGLGALHSDEIDRPRAIGDASIGATDRRKLRPGRKPTDLTVRGMS